LPGCAQQRHAEQGHREQPGAAPASSKGRGGAIASRTPASPYATSVAPLATAPKVANARPRAASGCSTAYGDPDQDVARAVGDPADQPQQEDRVHRRHRSRAGSAQSNAPIDPALAAKLSADSWPGTPEQLATSIRDILGRDRQTLPGPQQAALGAAVYFYTTVLELFTNCPTTVASLAAAVYQAPALVERAFGELLPGGSYLGYARAAGAELAVVAGLPDAAGSPPPNRTPRRTTGPRPACSAPPAGYTTTSTR
jgi:hypothetical protein